MSIGRKGASSQRDVPIHLDLLGSVAALADGVPVHCPSKKGFALFAFLALDRRPQPRNALAALLWGGRDPEAARGSLRTTLFRLPRPMARCLVIGRESVAIAPAALLTSDVGRFEALASAGEVGRMVEAVSLYRGPLLSNFDPEASPEFDDWLNRERARLAQLAYALFDRALRALVTMDASETESAPNAAIAIARQWLAVEPAAERAHRWLIRMHLGAGNAEAAQAQYESCRRALAVNEGRTPDQETLALMASASSAAPTPAPSTRATRTPAVPPPAVASTSFVGRSNEVAAIVALLKGSACRMLTLHGLGGVGKTRLAHAVMQQLAETFPDGTAWLSLEGVERPATVADAMARALAIDVHPGTAAREALLERLQGRCQLIVLDNFEHLLSRPAADAAADDPVELLLALLRAAPDVRLLVTSREALDVQEEWVYGVDGLGWRASQDMPGDEQALLPAVELFTQRARQADPRFPAAAQMPHVLSICARVEGLPLGIELAAAWVRTIPCAEIAHALERGLEVPPSRQRNRPQRQQSLRAVIEFSWRLLAGEEQDALCALSEFRGGFTREAAEAVARATLRALATLVDKALVRRSSEGRYSLHPLVRNFAAEQLARSPRRRATLRERHADHFLQMLREGRAALYGEQWAHATRELEKELDNVRAAWAAKVAARDFPALRDSARPLCLIFDRLGLHEEWTRTFDEALAALDHEASEEAQPATQALEVSAAYGHWRRGDAARARTYRAQVETWIGSAGDAAALADLHKLCGLIDRDSGDLDAALRHFTSGAEAAQTAGDVTAQAQLANEIGVVHWQRGDLAAARDAFATSLNAHRALRNVFDMPMSLHNVAFCEMELGRFDEADEGFGRALQMFRERAHVRGEAMVMSSLGILARRRGDLERAETLSRACLALAERTGSPGAVADAIDDLAQVVERRGALVEAEALYRRALAMARELGLMHLQCMVLLHLARTQAAAGTPIASARSLLEALVLADDHDIHAGRMIAILGAAGLRIARDDPDAATIARRWRDSVLAVAGANVDVKDAVPGALRTDELPRPGDGPPERVLRSTANEVLDFLRQLAADR